MLSVFFSSACKEEGIESSLSSTIPPTMKPVTPTEEATPTPSTTISRVEVEGAELNKEIQDFINKIGKYSDEAINDRLMTYYDDKLSLGWVGEGLGSIDFQGQFLGYVKVDDYIILAIGFSDDSGENLVKPIGILINCFNNQSLGFPFVETDSWSILTYHKAVWETSDERILNRLDRVKGNPILLNFLCEMDDVSFEQAIDTFGESSRFYIENLVNSIPLVKALVSDVAVSANEEILHQKTVYKIDIDFSIPNICNLQELMSVDISKVPLVSMISSNMW